MCKAFKSKLGDCFKLNEETLMEFNMHSSLTWRFFGDFQNLEQREVLPGVIMQVNFL